MDCIKCGKQLGRGHQFPSRRPKTGCCRTCCYQDKNRSDKISKAISGSKNGMFGKPSTLVHYWAVKSGQPRSPKGALSPLWKGGKKLRIKRDHAKRRTYGFNQINEYFEGSEGHHIDKEHVIYIPKELHRSVWHSLGKPETIEQINTKAICWLLGGVG